MADKKYKLVQDEPLIFLDARKNPVRGRRLTFEYEDGTMFEVDVTPSEYKNPEVIKKRLEEMIAAHLEALKI